MREADVRCTVFQIFALSESSWDSHSLTSDSAILASPSRLEDSYGRGLLVLIGTFIFTAFLVWLGGCSERGTIDNVPHISGNWRKHHVINHHHLFPRFIAVAEIFKSYHGSESRLPRGLAQTFKNAFFAGRIVRASV